MKNLIIIFAAVIFTNLNVQSQNSPLINSPNLSPDGKTIAFNHQGDIWTANILGNNLKRLTIHEAYDTKPVWSKDGKTIAFQSDRYGNNDIFIIPFTGGTPKRITYHSTNDRITDFTANNDIIFSTSRNFVQVEREPEVHSVSASGGTPTRLLDAVGFDATLSPNKKFIAFTRGSCRIEREAYKGPANRNIWVYDIENDKYNQLTTFNGQDLLPRWADNETIYFQSARSGKYNVHKLSIDGQGKKQGDVSQISSLKNMGIDSFDISENGNDIILVSGDNVSLLKTDTKVLTPVSITINSDYRFDPIVRKTYSGDATESSVSPNAKYSAIVIRGEIFITENDTKKSRTINVSNSPYRDIDVAWLNNSTLLFISDRDGNNNMYTVKSGDLNNKNQ